MIVLLGAIRATHAFEAFWKNSTCFEMNYFALFSRKPHGRFDSFDSIPMQLMVLIWRLTCFRRLVTEFGEQSLEPAGSVVGRLSKKCFCLVVGTRAARYDYCPCRVSPAHRCLPDRSQQFQRSESSWLLKAKADVPGVDYSDEFELPVFRNASSLSMAGASAFADGMQTKEPSGEQCGRWNG